MQEDTDERPDQDADGRFGEEMDVEPLYQDLGALAKQQDQGGCQQMDVGEKAAVLTVLGVMPYQRLAAGMLVKFHKVVIDTVLVVIAAVIGLAICRTLKGKQKQISVMNGEKMGKREQEKRRATQAAFGNRYLCV